MNRRSLLSADPAAVALVGAAGHAVAAPNPDTDLLAVCAEFNACDVRQRAIYDGPDAVEDDGQAALAAAPIFARMHTLLDHMEHLRAASATGIAARAGSLAQHSGGREFSFDAQDTITGRLLGYLLRDAAALGRAGASLSANPDVELIRVCHRFAEAELASWFRYVVALPGLADTQDGPPDWNTLHWIEDTPAVTPEGWCAKALALSAWHRDVFDDPEDDRDGHTPLLASLVRDMVAPTRAVIIARLVEQYGPLPEGYTADGLRLGRAAV